MRRATAGDRQGAAHEVRAEKSDLLRGQLPAQDRDRRVMQTHPCLLVTPDLRPWARQHQVRLDAERDQRPSSAAQALVGSAHLLRERIDVEDAHGVALIPPAPSRVEFGWRAHLLYSRVRMNILGINAFHGDASAALVKDGRLVVGHRGRAAEPAQALRGLPGAGDPRRARERRRQARLRSITSRSRAIPRRTCTRRSSSRCRSARRSPSWSRTGSPTSPRCAASRMRWPRRWARKRGDLRAKLHNVEHHKSHISSAFFVSGFEEAACLSIDGFGDFVSTMRAVGRDRDLDDHRSRRVPALGRALLHGDHPVPGLPQVRRGVEDDGARALRQAAYVDQLERVIRPTSGGQLRARPAVLPPPQRGRRDDLGRRLARARQGLLRQADRAARPGARSRGSGVLRQVGRHRAQRADRLRADLLPRARRICTSAPR